MIDATTVLQDLNITDPLEYAYLEGFVLWFNDYLDVQYGLKFNDDGVIQTKQLKTSENAISRHFTPFVRNISIIAIKDRRDANQRVLEEGTDYIVYKHRLAPNPVYEIYHPDVAISDPYYLEVTGDYTFDDEVPDSILTGFVDLLYLALGNYRYNKNLANNAGQTKKRTEIGDVKVTWSDSVDRVVAYDKLIMNSNLINILSIYRV